MLQHAVSTTLQFNILSISVAVGRLCGVPPLMSFQKTDGMPWKLISCGRTTLRRPTDFIITATMMGCLKVTSLRSDDFAVSHRLCHSKKPMGCLRVIRSGMYKKKSPHCLSEGPSIMKALFLLDLMVWRFEDLKINFQIV